MLHIGPLNQVSLSHLSQQFYLLHTLNYTFHLPISGFFSTNISVTLKFELVLVRTFRSTPLEGAATASASLPSVEQHRGRAAASCCSHVRSIYTEWWLPRRVKSPKRVALKTRWVQSRRRTTRPSCVLALKTSTPSLKWVKKNPKRRRSLYVRQASSSSQGGQRGCSCGYQLKLGVLKVRGDSCVFMPNMILGLTNW